MELPAVNRRTASEQRHSRKTAITSPKASAACVLSACVLLERADSSRQEDAVWPFFLKLMLQECVFSAT